MSDWHFERAAGMHAMPYDIVGYTFGADNWCPACITEVLIKAGLTTGGLLAHAERVGLSVEGQLDDIAEFRHFDRSDEGTYDSSQFPKVLLRQMLTHGDEGYGDGEDHSDRCGKCGEELGS